MSKRSQSSTRLVGPDLDIDTQRRLFPELFASESTYSLKRALKESPSMTAFHTKEWLRKQARYYASHSKVPGASMKKSKKVIRTQYLMSDQEIKQGEIIEAIFKNFDSDGSGSLDINELVELFRANGVILDKDTVR